MKKYTIEQLIGISKAYYYLMNNNIFIELSEEVVDGMLGQQEMHKEMTRKLMFGQSDNK